MSGKSAFGAVLDEIGGKGCTIILDKGFFSAKNIEMIEGMDFIRKDGLIPRGLPRLKGIKT
jgi:hypothetical protein